MSENVENLMKAVWKTLTIEELNHQYSCSKWSNRIPEDKIIDAHIKAAEEKSNEVRKTIPGRLDVAYGTKPRTKLDVFGEDLPNESNIVLYVHGGYWQLLDKDVSSYPVGPLYKNGIVSVIVDYTLAPEANLSQIVEEVRESVIWTCRLAEERRSKGVTLMGHSAGGHLITQVLSTFNEKDIDKISSIRGFVALSGIFDVRPLVSTYVNEPLHLDEKTAWDLSPLANARSLVTTFPSVFGLIIVGDQESPEFKRQSQQYNKLLNHYKMKANYEEIKNADHFNLVEDLSLPDYILVQKIIAAISAPN